MLANSLPEAVPAAAFSEHDDDINIQEGTKEEYP